MNILIIGNGYVGSQIFSRADKVKNKYWIHSRKTLDYHDQSVLRKFLMNNDISYVINCSGFTGRPNVDECETRKEECWNLNVVVPVAVSNTCKALDINYIHVSSGCIYNGYSKEWSETDVPNFGLYNKSSFYSKSKHAFETLNNYGCTIRIRMPFAGISSDREYLLKLLKYNNLIDVMNSKTYIPDLCRFIEQLIATGQAVNKFGIINFVNPQPLTTSDVVLKMKHHGLENLEWQFVNMSYLKLAAPRSNCVLDISKLTNLFPTFTLLAEEQVVDEALYNLKNAIT